MIRLLYLLCFFLVLGGLTSIFWGAQIIVLERGWSMVIAGSVFTTCGLILTFLTQILKEFIGFRHLLDKLVQHSSFEGQPESFRSNKASSSHDAASAAAMAAVTQALDFSPGDNVLAGGNIQEKSNQPELPFHKEQRSEAKEFEAQNDELSPLNLIDEKKEPEVNSDRSVMGAYTTGGNTYIMYSDGSIEAETPNGNYQFSNLDDLKVFISSGVEMVSDKDQ